jgi:hypothetical protein
MSHILSTTPFTDSATNACTAFETLFLDSSSSYWLLLRGIVEQSASRTAAIFWSIARTHVDFNHPHSSITALWLQQTHLVAKQEVEEKCQRILPTKYHCHTQQGSNGMGLRLYFLSEGSRATDFIALRKHRSRSGLNSRTLGPKTSTITTRPPKTTVFYLF